MGFDDFPEEEDEIGGGAELPQRGWLPPEDRLWRHPSEVARQGLPPSFAPLPGADGSRGRSRRSSLTVGVVATAAVAAAVAVSLTMVDGTGWGSRAEVLSATSTSFDNVSLASQATASTSIVAGADVMRLISAMRPSLVSITPMRATPSSTPITGVVLPGGELALTAAAAVGGAATMEVRSADGQRHVGDVVGVDPHAGVAVITTGGGLTPATFADEVVTPGDLAVAACLCSRSLASTGPARASTTWAVGMIRQVGTTVTLGGGGQLVDAIEAEAPLGPASPGGVLLDGRGQVIGIMDGHVSDGAERVGVFVPAALARAVAMQLATDHKVDHGWLGIVCAQQDPDGALVEQILPGSPAVRAGLHPGDKVVAVGTHPVGSLADLQARLYTMPPGAPVQLTVVDGTTSAVVTVTLADSPGG